MWKEDEVTVVCANKSCPNGEKFHLESVGLPEKPSKLFPGMNLPVVKCEAYCLDTSFHSRWESLYVYKK